LEVSQLDSFIAFMALTIEQLMKHGENPLTPIAIIENATYTYQRVITGSLNNLVHLINFNQVKYLALIAIGKVAKSADELAWFHPQTHLNSDITIIKNGISR